ncbi:MAG: superoxide dismutase [Actinomycetota bacterium]|nr:superoxide dismutase [Actinomycetota bacterium]
MRRLLIALLTVLLLPLAAPAVAGPEGKRGGHRFPDRIELPQGFQPEGIEAGRGPTVYVGSLRDGSIWRGNVRTGRGEIWAAPVGVPTVGLAFDRRHKLLWAAGGPSGQVRAYDIRTGTLVRTYTVAGSGFLNDLTVTRKGVYVTDSAVQRLVVVRFGRGQALPAEATTLPITGDLRYVEGFNANGIVDKRGYLLVVQTATGQLFRIDPRTGASVRVDTGGVSLLNGDGMELRGRTLFVVRNRDNVVVRLKLRRDLLEARSVRTLTGATDVPTTVTIAAGRLYVVNARFGNPSPQTADYWITKIERRCR